MVRVRVGVRVGVGQTVTGRVPVMSHAEFAHRATYGLGLRLLYIVGWGQMHLGQHGLVLGKVLCLMTQNTLKMASKQLLEPERARKEEDRHGC